MPIYWDYHPGTLSLSQVTSVAHCSWSQDIDLFKFQLSYCYNPFQDTCPITSVVLGHLVRTDVPLIFLDRDKKSYRLSEKCATLSHCNSYEDQAPVKFHLQVPNPQMSCSDLTIRQGTRIVAQAIAARATRPISPVAWSLSQFVPLPCEGGPSSR